MTKTHAVDQCVPRGRARALGLSLLAWAIFASPATPATTHMAQDESVLEFVGQTGGRMGVVVAQGDRVYEVMGTSVGVLDVSTPAAPRLVERSRPLNNLIDDLAVAGHRAFLATSGGIHVMDLNAPGGPEVVSTFTPDGLATLVATSGDFVLAVVRRDFAGELLVLRVRDDDVLEVVGRTTRSPMVFGARQIAVDGQIAYLAAGPSGVLAFALSDPSAPAMLGAYEDLTAESLAVGTGRIFTAGFREREGNERGAKITDRFVVALSTRPGTFLTSDVELLFGETSGTAFIGAWAPWVLTKASDPSRLMMYDGSQPATLPVAGEMDLPWQNGAVGPKSIAVADGYLYFAVNGTCGLNCRGYGRKSGLLVIDVDAPAKARVAGTFLLDEPSSPFLVAAGDGSAAVCDDTMTVHFLETRSPTMPRYQGAIVTENTPTQLAADGNLLLVGNNLGGWLVDMSDPSRPLLGDSFSLRDTFALDISGGIVYAVGREGEARDQTRLVSWEIGSDQRLHRRGDLVLSNSKWFLDRNMVVRDGLAVVGSTGPNLLLFIDVRDPGNMKLMATLPIPSQAMGLDIAGDHAFVVSRLKPIDGSSRDADHPYAGLSVVDVSDRSNPRFVGTYGDDLEEFRVGDQDEWGVAVSGNTPSRLCMREPCA